MLSAPLPLPWLVWEVDYVGVPLGPLHLHHPWLVWEGGNVGVLSGPLHHLPPPWLG